MPVAPAPRPDVAALRTLRAPARFEFGAAACASLLVAAALIKLPLLAVAAVGILVLGTTMGIEALIVVFVLGACGVLPFVNVDTFVSAQVKVYAFFFLLALAAMLVAYVSRGLAGKASWPLPANLMSLGLVALLAYVVLVALGSHPSEVPSLAAPFAILPLSGLAVILWLSHDDALQGLRRVLPLAIVIVAAWALAYDAGAAGCGPCREWVGTGVTNSGLLGPGSRLYTAGQNTFLGLFLIAFAYTLVRPRPLAISLTCLGAFTIALQGSRAQYIAVAAGMALLLIWKMGQLRVGKRVVLAVVTALTVLAVANSPVGQRTINAYSETQQGKGTGAYRLELIESTSKNWTPLGDGFSTQTLERGFDVDLGMPNTLLVLGYVGAALQLFLIGIGIWRGVAARTAVGATIAAVLVMVLVSRPSLPLLEYGHSAVMYGAVLGFAAALSIVSRRTPIRDPSPAT